MFRPAPGGGWIYRAFRAQSPSAAQSTGGNTLTPNGVAVIRLWSRQPQSPSTTIRFPFLGNKSEPGRAFETIPQRRKTRTLNRCIGVCIIIHEKHRHSPGALLAQQLNTRAFRVLAGFSHVPGSHVAQGESDVHQNLRNLSRCLRSNEAGLKSANATFGRGRRFLTASDSFVAL